MYVADVVINSNARELDRLFSYSLDEELFSIVERGARVIVPFGKGDRPTEGIIVGKRIEDHSELALKHIISLVDWTSMINSDLLDLTDWMVEEYLTTRMDCFKLVLPPGNFSNIRQLVSVPAKIIKNKTSSSEKELIDYLNTWVGKGFFRDTRFRGKWDERLINRVLTRLLREKAILISYSLKDAGESEKLKLVALQDAHYSPTLRAVREKEILDYLNIKKNVSLSEMRSELSYSPEAFRKLIQKNVISLEETSDSASALKNNIGKYSKKTLTKEQKKVLELILLSNEKEYFIHGVTGSGKTEIYLNLVEEMLGNSKSAIILVPEISLTPQMLDRFIGRFGSKVAVIHSKLSPKDRLEQWKRIRNGEVQIAVGARSAIFAPFLDLGLIIIDEEHENSFKASSGVRYDTVQVAKKRAMLCNAKLVLGSATPDIRSYHSCMEGNCRLLPLKNRITSNPLTFEIVDMSEEMKAGNTSILSHTLFRSMQSALRKKEQIILFLNRKGYSTSLTCRKCGLTMKCKRCDISLSYYRSKESLKCSYCGSLYPVPKLCPDCGDPIGYFGIGTEMVEDIIHRLFPDARISRMDQESTTTIKSHDRIYREMLNGEIDILIGTQMLSKGLDFPRVSLVGVLMADMSLNIPDYRANERTFQLLTQVSGRAGRADIPGKAIIQTYNPDHFVIQSVRSSSYEEFYKNEIMLRREFQYPPFCELILIGFSGENRIKVEEKAKEFYVLWKQLCIETALLTDCSLGPNPAPIEWINKRYRFHLLIKVKKEQIYLMKQVLKRVYKQTTVGKQSVRVVIDINPASIM